MLRPQMCVWCVCVCVCVCVRARARAYVCETEREREGVRERERAREVSVFSVFSRSFLHNSTNYPNIHELRKTKKRHI